MVVIPWRHSTSFACAWAASSGRKSTRRGDMVFVTEEGARTARRQLASLVQLVSGPTTIRGDMSLTSAEPDR